MAFRTGSETDAQLFRKLVHVKALAGLEQMPQNTFAQCLIHSVHSSLSLQFYEFHNFVRLVSAVLL